MKKIEDLKAALAHAHDQIALLQERHDFLKEAFDALSDEHDHVYDVVKKNLESVSERMKKDLKCKQNLAHDFRLDFRTAMLKISEETQEMKQKMTCIASYLSRDAK